MNRHSSNPFLSDWDEPRKEDIATAVQQARALVPGAEQTQHQQQQPQRRSSCSQAESNPHSATGTAARQGLYRRNMSSFEAASLQLEQHQQQMLENGSPHIAHSDLIAKMTADFQSAIDTNDKQFALGADGLGFNPFDPFETIVDDDVSLPSPAPTKEAPARDTINGESTNGENGATFVQATNWKHDSIDEDEEELVSTPVRKIKASEATGVVGNQVGGEPGSEAAQKAAFVMEATAEREQTNDCDSRAKASLFASLLASAEISQQQQQPGADPAYSTAASPADANNHHNNQETDNEELNQIWENSTHVIKGSPSSAGGDVERPVGFFDPFETVIDKDALSELMSSSHESAQHDNSTAITPGLHHRSLAAIEAEAQSGSIETVIENTATRGDVEEAMRQLEDSMQTATTSTPSEEAKVASSYDSSIALNRPSHRKLAQPASGVIAPQPTPLRRPKQKATGRQRRSSFQEDSSDSEEEDDRIQIVIRAKEEAPAAGEASGAAAASQQQPVLVPLLPPPPSKNSMRQARERGQVEDMPSPLMSYKSRQAEPGGGRRAKRPGSSSSSSQAAASDDERAAARVQPNIDQSIAKEPEESESGLDNEEHDDGHFVIPMRHSDLEDDDGDNYGKSDTPLYDDDTSYQLEEYPPKYEGPGWEMMLRYPPKKKLTSNRFWKKIFVKLAQVPLAVDAKTKQQQQQGDNQAESAQTCWALQIFDKLDDRKPIQEIPIQATYTVSEISSQLFDQFGKLFTIKLQYIFYKERVGVRQGQLARFIHSGHIGTSTTSGGHGVDPISIGAIKRMGAPIEHSPQISQIIKLGCSSYEDIKQFKECLEDCLFRMPIHRDRALSTYKTEEVQMAVRDETYIEVNQIGTITRQIARVRLFFLSFLNGNPVVEVGINDIHRQGREVVGRMDILPVVTEEWIRLEAWELHSTVEANVFNDVESRLIKLSPPDATFFELMRFRVRPPRNRELPLQISANMSVSRTKVSINCEVMIPGYVSRKHGQIPCENIAIRVHIPECWIYFFREEKHFRMGSKKSVNRRPGKVKGIERFLGGGGGLQDLDDESSLIEVTSGQAKYEHHHHAVVWRAARWPKESQSAYVQNKMKIRLPLTAYDKMPENFYEFVHAEYTMPATTVSHTTLRSISVNPCEDEPPEKYVKYSAKYDYKVKMRLTVNIGTGTAATAQESEAPPIVIMKQPDHRDDLQKEEDSDDDSDDLDAAASAGGD